MVAGCLDYDAIMTEHKKSVKTMLTKPFKALNITLFQNKKKEKEKQAEKEIKEKIEIKKEIVDIQVEKVIENFEKLKVQKQNEEELKQFTFKTKVEEEEDDDELENFSFKPVEDERKAERTDSQSSQDSGFSEKEDLVKDEHELQDDVLESLKSLKIEQDLNEKDEKEAKEKDKLQSIDTEKEKTQDKEKLEEEHLAEKEKKKKLQTVAVSRGPIKNRTDHTSKYQPYAYPEPDRSFEHINQVNRQTFSGGHVIYNPKIADDVTTDFIDDVVNQFQQSIAKKSPEELEQYLDDVENYIQNDHNRKDDFEGQFFNPEIIDQCENSNLNFNNEIAIAEPNDNQIEAQGTNLNFNNKIQVSDPIAQESHLNLNSNTQIQEPTQFEQFNTADYYNACNLNFKSTDVPEPNPIEQFKELIQDDNFDINIQNSYLNLNVDNQASPSTNPIEEFEQLTQTENYDTVGLTLRNLTENLLYYDPSLMTNDTIMTNETAIDIAMMNNDTSNSVMSYDNASSIFLTPPRSETMVSSPHMYSPFNTTSSDYTPSPQIFSPASENDIQQLEYENIQEIQLINSPNETKDIPVCVTEKEKKRERKTSTSKNLSQYRNMLKDLNAGFAKLECCKTDKDRKSCKELFQEHLNKLKMDERKHLCVQVSGFDLKTTYGVLHHVLMSLSRGSEHESLDITLFSLLCDRLLARHPEELLRDHGLHLLQAAALRCPDKPLLTRYLVQCIRTAIKTTGHTSEEPIFTEVDKCGDTLVSACARAGDRCAGVLAELVRKTAADLPLFDVDHRNADGYSALHVACRLHGGEVRCLHTAHVLLAHGQANIWLGDVRGGDTALHLAVNSATCDLDLVLLIFSQVPRDQWNKLARHHNMSSVTPMQYARSAIKATRKNYPPEVEEFLGKCRQYPAK